MKTTIIPAGNIHIYLLTEADNRISCFLLFYSVGIKDSALQTLTEKYKELKNQFLETQVKKLDLSWSLILANQIDKMVSILMNQAFF